ncbi:X [Jungle carpet python virus]|uniref:X n=1 Tax=Jungle carpet python virus TaxID=2016401 RepID=A0A2K8MNG3_9MONO|nr:X [Jungle carpet python virus] [Jungle carpet python virus]ATY47617.1 X [Jungle carpet python virus] [Jungle carpet python virus]
MDVTEEIRVIAELIRRARLGDGVEVNRTTPRGRPAVQADSSTRRNTRDPEDTRATTRRLRSSNRDGERVTRGIARESEENKEETRDNRSTE